MEYLSIGVLLTVRIATRVSGVGRAFRRLVSTFNPAAWDAIPTWRNTPTLQHSITPRDRIRGRDDDEVSGEGRRLRRPREIPACQQRLIR